MKHFYCGRLTHIVVDELKADVTAFCLDKTEQITEIVVVDTEEFTTELANELNEKYADCRKRVITTNGALAVEGWETAVVPVVSLPVINLVLEV